MQNICGYIKMYVKLKKLWYIIKSIKIGFDSLLTVLL